MVRSFSGFVVGCGLGVAIAVSPAFAGRVEEPPDPNALGDIIGNCGFPNGGAGCSDATCQTCVCTLDAFCCNVAWDGICVDTAGDECLTSCSGEPSVRAIIPTPALGASGEAGLILAVLGVGAFFLRKRRFEALG